MGRECRLFIVAARKSAGKSFSTDKLMQQYVKGSAKTPPRRCLILDVNDEYTQYKALRIQDITLFSVHPLVEIRRIRPFYDDGKKMTLDDIANTLFLILETYRNGLLLIEDPSKYISDTMPNDLVGAICTNRHIGLDIIMHYQSIGRITSKVWQNVNMIRLHKCTDTVKKHQKKFEDKYEYLSIMECMINRKYNNGDIRFFCYADVDNEKIFGAFTDEDMEMAVDDFIKKEYNYLVKPMLNERNEKGGRIHTPQSAYTEVKKRLMAYKRQDKK